MVIVVGAITASSTVRNIATPSLLDTRVPSGIKTEPWPATRVKRTVHPALAAGRRSTATNPAM